MGLRQKWMIPSCCPWKVVIFISKEHVNWFSTSEAILGRSWKILFEKLKISVLELKIYMKTKKIIDFSKIDCSTSIYHNSTKTRPSDMFIECEGWRQYSSLIFLILLFTKPNIEVSGWLYLTKTHFTHIVYQYFSRVSPPSFTLYGHVLYQKM